MPRAVYYSSSSALDGPSASKRRHISPASHFNGSEDDPHSPQPKPRHSGVARKTLRASDQSHRQEDDQSRRGDDSEDEGDEEDEQDEQDDGSGADDEGDEDEEDVDEEDEDEGEEDDEGHVEVAEQYRGWNVHEYQQRPLTKDIDGLIPKAKTKLSLQISVIQSAMAQALTTATAFEEVEEGSEVVEQIADLYLKLLDKRSVLIFQVDATGDLTKALKEGESIADPMAWWKDRWKKKESAWTTKTIRQKFKDDEDYKSFRQTIWDCHHSGQPCPPMTDYLPAQAGDSDDEADNSDDDVRIGVQTQVYTDPISLKPFVDAVVVDKCGHHYSRDTIMGMLAQQKKGRKMTGAERIKCPRADCKIILGKGDIQEDPQFQARVDAHQARQTQKQKHAEAEATDEDVVDVEEDEDEDMDDDD